MSKAQLSIKDRIEMAKDLGLYGVGWLCCLITSPIETGKLTLYAAQRIAEDKILNIKNRLSKESAGEKDGN